MRNHAALRRAAWLRRTRQLTVWIAGVAAAATLLIAAVVGSASPTRKAIALRSPRTRLLVAPVRRTPAGASLRRQRVAQPGRVHASVPTRRPVQHAAVHAAATAAPAPVAQAPTPAPAAVPVVVSGGS